MWLLLGLAAVFALDKSAPGLRFTHTGWQLVGAVVIVAGLALLVLAGGLFKQAGTDMIPFRNVTALVTDGVYRFSRNPMYLGMALVLLGTALTVGAASALVVPLVFAIVVEWRYIRPEEELLAAQFPEAFAAYRRRVRRWL
jgi:protein-S-isoprenylcysteine O-methyltransferase Ste14